MRFIIYICDSLIINISRQNIRLDRILLTYPYYVTALPVWIYHINLILIESYIIQALKY